MKFFLQNCQSEQSSNQYIILSGETVKKKTDFFFSPETANLTKVGSLVGVFESETNETHERY